MQELVTPHPRFDLWLRLRKGVAALMFLAAFLEARKAFLHFEWVPLFCLGMCNLLDLYGQKGEPMSEYLRKPRAIASIAFAVAAVVGSGYLLFK